MFKIKDNICNCIANSNDDIYSGSFTLDYNGTNTYIYLIHFKTGTQTRGHIITDFKLYQANNGRLLEIEDAQNSCSEIVEQILEGF